MSSESDDQTFRSHSNTIWGSAPRVTDTDIPQRLQALYEKELRRALVQGVPHAGEQVKQQGEYKMRNRHDLSSAERKQMPVYRGTLKYFPDALMIVAMLSKRADLKHSPEADPDDLDRPKWVRHKSADHGDCVVRHQLDVGDMDKELGLDYAVHVAWRGLAQLQELIDSQGIDSLIDWDWHAEQLLGGYDDKA